MSNEKKWRPIETAPRDKTPILVRFFDVRKKRLNCAVVEWCEGVGWSLGDGPIPVGNAVVWCVSTLASPPTRWMPCPSLDLDEGE